MRRGILRGGRLHHVVALDAPQCSDRASLSLFLAARPGHARKALGVMNEVRAKLELLGCHGGADATPCAVYVTGHGPGAALAQLVAWELAAANYTLGTTYLFNAPLVGDETFANKMRARFARGAPGTIFNVVTGKGSPWPSAVYFKPWAIEAYYEGVTSRPLELNCGTRGFRERSGVVTPGPRDPVSRVLSHRSLTEGEVSPHRH